MRKVNRVFVHSNRSKKPAKTLDKSISNNIILLYDNKFQMFNFKHFYDYLIEEEIEIIVSPEVALKNSHPRGEKTKCFGEITEMDGSIHLWFGEKRHVSILQ